jgi:hypothetical protein
MLLERRAIDLLSAALRHARDAESLLAPQNPGGQSIDQAFHLAGYGPECARKATLGLRDFDKTIGHRFDGRAEGVLDALVALDPWALRYGASGWGARFPALAEWKETARYHRTGTADAACVDFVATEDSDLDGMWAPARALGAESERVQVFPAGELNRRYLDKLARLDFTVATFAGNRPAEISPTAAALRALTQRIAQQDPRPDAILIDSRAGLHDLAGLSLHGLAHVDVLLTRAGEQGYRGLDLTLAVLASRKKKGLSCILVHAMGLRKGAPGAEEEALEFRQRSYDIFRSHVYTEMCGYDPDSIPALESAADLHSPHPLYFNADLHRFLDLAERRSDLLAEDYLRLRARIDELTEPEEPEDAP